MIWVIAGTLDGRNLSVAVQEHTKLPVLVSVVSQYGAKLAAHEGIEVHEGRLSEDDMVQLIEEKKISLLVDASHPYAAIVTETAQKAAKRSNIPYLRYERKEVELPAYDQLHHVSSEQEAADLAATLGEIIYLTTGSKTMHIFAKAESLQAKTVWTRVLPTAEVLTMLEDLGVSPKYTIGMQGPFSYDMNRIMFHDTKAEVVIMKNSGLVGGSDTKLQAAMDLGVHIIVIDRPQVATQAETISTIEEFITFWEEHHGLH